MGGRRRQNLTVSAHLSPGLFQGLLAEALAGNLGGPLAGVLTGVFAGLGVALPLGAIGVLLVQEGLARGWNRAAAGATGVALVDLAYAGVAVAFGTAVSGALAGHERAVHLVGAAVLVAVAVRGLWDLRGPAPTGAPPRVDPSAATRGRVTGDASTVRPGRVLGRFVVLTAVNPLTAVYFVVLSVGLGSRLAGPGDRAAFVLGVFLGSWAWQLVLAGAGTLAGARLPGWARTATGLAGYLVVLGYAAVLTLG